MANPPFNVDLVDAERIKGDPRLPFGLPGVNKQKKVSNGNYLWISYFWSYLNEKGRAGFVMSSQASSAGHGEKEVRRKIVETGDVDVMISIRSNFFYTRTVPCELWYFDRAKPAERRDKVLMLDARNVYRKVTRKIYDFSPEQMQNLAAIVWLYRGQRERFLGLVKDYFGRVCAESAAIPGDARGLRDHARRPARAIRCAGQGRRGTQRHSTPTRSRRSPMPSAELREAAQLYEADATKLLDESREFRRTVTRSAARQTTTPSTPRARRSTPSPRRSGASSSRWTCSTSSPLALPTWAPNALPTEDGNGAGTIDRRATRPAGEAARRGAQGRRRQFKHAAYFHRQIVWLQDRFPKAELKPCRGW